MIDKKKSLGKGLSALFQSNGVNMEGFGSQSAETMESSPADTRKNELLELELYKITTNPYQPRKDFDDAALKDLADSIRQNGIIQPITVRPSTDGLSYELISGERRLRASRLAGLQTVPVYIKPVDSDVHLMEMAIIENIQREDLNPMELSDSYQRLSDEFGLTQEKIAEKVSKQRSTVANFLRLQKLPDEIKSAVRRNDITEAHARMLLRIEDPDEQINMLSRITSENITVKALEELTKGKAKTKKKKPVKFTDDNYFQGVEDKLRIFFGTKVKVKGKGKKGGEISIEFYSDDDLERIIDRCS